jgi:hypothetical protein
MRATNDGMATVCVATPVNDRGLTLSSIRNCRASSLLVASLVFAGAVSAQSTRHLSLVGSWRVSDVYPFGQEFQLRYGSEKWSVGGGYMDSWRLGLFNNSANQESIGLGVHLGLQW